MASDIFSSYQAIDALLGGNAGSLDNSSGAVAQSISLIDKQIALILSAHSHYSNLAKNDQMQQAMDAFLQATSTWPVTCGHLIAALHYIEWSAGKAWVINKIPDALVTVDTLQGLMSALQTGVNLLALNLDNAIKELQSFLENLQATYREHRNAQEEMEDRITAMQSDLQQKIEQAQREKDNLTSASSVLFGVVTCGIYTLNQISNLNDEIQHCVSLEQQIDIERQLYYCSLAALTTAQGAVEVSCRTTALLNSAVQQVNNQLNDICTRQNNSLPVMKAFIATFETQAAAAAARITEQLGENK